MMMARTTKDFEYTRNRVHPQKFALWLAIVSMCMFFAAYTSAFLVRQASGNWLEFEIPNIFYVNTAIILLSSITLHASYYFFKKMNTVLYRLLLLVSLILGIAFIVVQYMGWESLDAMGVILSENASGDFVYVISGLHALHVIGGITALLLACVHAFSLSHKVTNTRKLRFELTLTYWHFVDILWVYLLIFFVTQG